MTTPKDLPDICPKTLKGKVGSFDWPCVRAVGHDGDCWPQVEAGYVGQPLENYDRDWLLGSLRLAWSQISSHDADRTEAYRREQERERPRWAVIWDVHGKGAGRSAKHDPWCFRRHPHCFAALFVQQGGIDRAFEAMRAEYLARQTTDESSRRETC
jgi:hypothetical protein